MKLVYRPSLETSKFFLYFSGSCIPINPNPSVSNRPPMSECELVRFVAKMNILSRILIGEDVHSCNSACTFKFFNRNTVYYRAIRMTCTSCHILVVKHE